MLWVLLLAALAVLVGGSSSFILRQRELSTASSYAFLRATISAENGIEWARARWLRAYETGEVLLPSRTEAWASADGVDRAVVEFSRQSDGRWSVSSEGSFNGGVVGSAKRHFTGFLPSLEQGSRTSLAVSGEVSGYRSDVILSPAFVATHLIAPSRYAGVSPVTLGGTHVSVATTPEIRIASPNALPIAVLPGSLSIAHEEDEILQLHTYVGSSQRLWTGGPTCRVLAVESVLQVGSDLAQKILVQDEILVLYADYIEIVGDFTFGDAANLWLIAKRGIDWQTDSTSGERLFRGLIWTPGSFRMTSASGASWFLHGAVFAGEMHLSYISLTFEEELGYLLPESFLPRRIELPLPANLRLLSPAP